MSSTTTKSKSGDASSPAASPPALNQARNTLKYFLTLLRGELVLAQLVDGSVYEGLFYTVELEKGNLVLHMAQKQLDNWSSAHSTPQTYAANDGSRNNTHSFEKVYNVPLTQLVQLSVSDLSLAEWSEAYQTWEKKNGGSNKAAGGNARGFATDSQISGVSDKERELVRWSGGADAGAASWDERELGTSSQSFNQFEAFEKMTGKTSTFKFDEYSTPLDRSSTFYKSNEARATAIANSIMSSDAGSAHVLMERQGDEDVNAAVDRNADEGELFSDVKRDGAHMPSPGPSADGKYKPGAFKAAKKAAAAAATTSPPAANGAAPTESPTKTKEPAAAAKSPEPSPPAKSESAAPSTPAAAASPSPAASTTAATPASTSTDSSSASSTASSTASTTGKFKLNPHAATFKLSAAAKEFTPSFGGAAAAAPVAAAAPAAAPAPFIPANINPAQMYQAAAAGMFPGNQFNQAAAQQAALANLQRMSMGAALGGNVLPMSNQQLFFPNAPNPQQQQQQQLFLQQQLLQAQGLVNPSVFQMAAAAGMQNPAFMNPGAGALPFNANAAAVQAAAAQMRNAAAAGVPNLPNQFQAQQLLQQQQQQLAAQMQQRNAFAQNPNFRQQF